MCGYVQVHLVFNSLHRIVNIAKEPLVRHAHKAKKDCYEADNQAEELIYLLVLLFVLLPSKHLTSCDSIYNIYRKRLRNRDALLLYPIQIYSLLLIPIIKKTSLASRTFHCRLTFHCCYRLAAPLPRHRQTDAYL